MPDFKIFHSSARPYCFRLEVAGLSRAQSRFRGLFDMGSAGWIVLHTGSEAGAWGAPGMAQRLLDSLPP